MHRFFNVCLRTEQNKKTRWILLPIDSCFLFEKFIKLQHFDPRNNVDFKCGQELFEQPEVVVNVAFSIPSHAAAGSPEDVCRVLTRIEQLLPAPQHPLKAGVSHDTQARALTNVLLIAYGGSIVHTDYTLRAVDFSTSPAPGQLTGAGHQSTSPAVHLQRLQGSKVRKNAV